MKLLKVNLLFFIFFISQLNAYELKRISKDNIESLNDIQLEEILNILNLQEDRKNPNIKWFSLKFLTKENECIYFSEIKQIFQVYEPVYKNNKIQELKKIYEYGNLKQPSYNGNPFHIICPQNSQVLFFRIYSYDTKRIGILGEVIIGTRDSFYIYIVKKEIPEIILGLMYFTVGISTLLLYFFYYRYDMFLHFGLFIFFLSIASLTTNNIKIVLYNYALFWSWINVIALYLTTVYSIIFASSFTYNKFKKYIIYIFIIENIIGIFLFLQSIFNSFYLYRLLIYSAYTAILNAIIAILYLLYNVHQKDQRSILFFTGILILASGAILDSLVIINFWEYNHLYFNITMFLFLMILVSIMMQEQKRVIKKLESIEIEFDLAYNVHRKFLPNKVPLFQNMIINYEYIPSYILGGDFIKFIEIDHRKLGVFIGDISGHGLSAALYSAVIYNFINTMKELYSKPVQFIQKMNEYFYEHLQSDFITAVYVFLDFEKKEFTYCSAGHTDIIYYTDNKILLLGSTGSAIGLKTKSNYKEYSIPIKNDSLLFLYTDGFNEIFNNKGELLPFIEFVYKFNKIHPLEKVQKNIFFDVLRSEINQNKNKKFHDDLAGIYIYFNNI